MMQQSKLLQMNNDAYQSLEGLSQEEILYLMEMEQRRQQAKAAMGSTNTLRRKITGN